MKNKIYGFLETNIIKNKYFYYICVIILFLILEVSELKIKLKNVGSESNLYIFVLIGIAIAITIFIVFIMNIKKKKNIENYKLFIILAFGLGLMYLIGAPLFSGSDEHNHYYRIYEITQGQLITPVSEKNEIGGKLPESLYRSFVNNDDNVINRNQRVKYKDEIETYNLELNKNNTVQYGTNYATEYVNTALYCPLQYLPQIIGFLIGELFNASPLILGELGRLFNLIFYVVICAYFLKRLPKFQTFAMLVLLSPTLLGNVTTLNADGFTISLIFGFLTLISIYSKGEDRIKTSDKIIVFVLSLLISSCKIVYIPFIFLLFLLPNKCFKNKKDKWIFNILCVSLGIIINLIWLKYTDIYFEVYYRNTEIQKQNILKNPFWYCIVVFRTYMKNFTYLLLNIVGGSQLYHTQLPVYDLIPISYIVILICSIFVTKRDSEKSYTKIQFGYIIIILLAVLALATTAIYVQCTANFIAINNSSIVGLQGRYYVALVLGMILLMNEEKIKNKFQIKDNEYLIDISLILHYLLLLQMFVCFAI